MSKDYETSSSSGLQVSFFSDTEWYLERQQRFIPVLSELW